MRIYLFYVFMGFFATFIYNYISNLLRGLGNSVVPLFFLALSVVLNIALDILFVAGFKMGIAGAAVATVSGQIMARHRQRCLPSTYQVSDCSFTIG